MPEGGIRTKSTTDFKANRFDKNFGVWKFFSKDYTEMVKQNESERELKRKRMKRNEME